MNIIIMTVSLDKASNGKTLIHVGVKQMRFPIKAGVPAGQDQAESSIECRGYRISIYRTKSCGSAGAIREVGAGRNSNISIRPRPAAIDN